MVLFANKLIVDHALSEFHTLYCTLNEASKMATNASLRKTAYGTLFWLTFCKLQGSLQFQRV